MRIRIVQVMNTYLCFLYFYSSKMDIGHELHLNKYEPNCIKISQQYIIIINVKQKYYSYPLHIGTYDIIMYCFIK